MSDAASPMQEYTDRLKHHDWYYAYSDDSRVYRNGSAAASTLSNLRKELDPDYSIWNKFAPEDFKVLSDDAREKGRQALAEIEKEGKTDYAKVRALVEDGAYVNTRDRDKRTLLILSIAKKDVRTVKYLISKDADINLRDEKGMSPVMTAALVGDAKSLDALIKKGADFKTAHYKGEFPIMMAAKGGHTDAVIVLLLAGADPKAKNWKVNAIDVAKTAGFDDLAKIMEASEDELRKLAQKRGLISKPKADFTAKSTKAKKPAKPVPKMSAAKKKCPKG